MKKDKKQKPAKPGPKPEESPASRDLPSPNRGAFPTPKEEIEKAKPFLPDSDKTNCRQPTEPDVPPDDDEEGGK